MKSYLYGRLCQWHNLFFLLFFFISCNTEQKEISIIWKNGKAVGIFIPTKMVKGLPKDSIANFITIRNTKNYDTTAILGNFSWHIGNEKKLYFEPLLPFTNEMNFDLIISRKKMASFSIHNENKTAPHVITIYPELDTVPMNLLKIYIRFSQPMREGMSANAICLIRNGKDSLRNVFLDLQPELWNEDRTVLTLWLDPGRIKRDLQPNQRFGNPLEEGTLYEMVIPTIWQNTNGIPLDKVYNWKFAATKRDSLCPQIDQWSLGLPTKDTRGPLQISLHETVDYFILLESVSIIDDSGKRINGRVEITQKCSTFQFIPNANWRIGKYYLQIDSKLEDLAGNNLNRPFDRDIKNSKKPFNQKFYTKSFLIVK